MAYLDLHRKAFDDGTLCKLEIFEAYIQAWLPTFIMQNAGTICIFDLFAGPGYDKDGIEGSPIRIIKQVEAQTGNIFQKDIRICVWLNEFKLDKYENLKSACEHLIQSHPELKRLCECKKLSVKYTNQSIEEIFPKIIRYINQYPSLALLDQNGVKYISDDYFLPIVKAKTTDFLFYVASSFIRRFASQKEFKNNLSFDLSNSKDGLPSDIHRWVVKQMQKRVPIGSKVRLYPFSIKKGSNVYGIIFGASHIFAVDKFLRIAWNQNSINGEANFDIDSDLKKNQFDLFSGKQLNKIEKFQSDLEDAMLSGQIVDNKSAYIYTIEHGHINSHADFLIRQMKKDGKIDFEGRSPKCNYEQVFRKNVFVKYIVL